MLDTARIHDALAHIAAADLAIDTEGVWEDDELLALEDARIVMWDVHVAIRKVLRLARTGGDRARPSLIRSASQVAAGRLLLLACSDPLIGSSVEAQLTAAARDLCRAADVELPLLSRRPEDGELVFTRGLEIDGLEDPF